jgi:hypothetical protein
MCKIEQFCGGMLSQSGQMRKEELTRKKNILVPCPTCGVTVGKRCILYSGGLRFEAHVARKLSAIEALEGK